MLTQKKNICEKRKCYHRKHIREKKKICLLIEKSFDEAAINFNKVTCDLFKFRSVTAFKINTGRTWWLKSLSGDDNLIFSVAFYIKSKSSVCKRMLYFNIPSVS